MREVWREQLSTKLSRSRVSFLVYYFRQCEKGASPKSLRQQISRAGGSRLSRPFGEATLGAFDNNHGESMVVEKQPDGSVAFKNVCTGKYISVTDDGSLLKAEGSRADLWELFDIYPYGHFDGGFVLRSRKNGKFVTVDESSGNRLAAICDGTPRSREVFSFLNHRNP